MHSRATVVRVGRTRPLTKMAVPAANCSAGAIPMLQCHRARVQYAASAACPKAGRSVRRQRLARSAVAQPVTAEHPMLFSPSTVRLVVTSMLLAASPLPAASQVDAATVPARGDPAGLRVAGNAAAPTDPVRRQAFIDARLQLEREFEATSRMRDSDLARYAMGARSYLERATRLADAYPGLPEARFYRRDLAKVAERLAPSVRFALRDPGHAVRLYRQAIELSRDLPGQEGFALTARMGLADTLRFDFRDTDAALAECNEMQARMAAAKRSYGDTEAILEHAAAAWLRAEIAYLAQGRRHSAKPDREVLAVIALLLQQGAESFSRDDPALQAMRTAMSARAPDDEERESFARQIESLSPSQTRLPAVFDYLPVLRTPERIAAFMRRHDPSGFLSAGAFGAWHLLLQERNAGAAPAQRNAGLQMLAWSARDREVMLAAERALLGRRIDADFTPDPRLSSPESTWKAFLAALSAGRLEDAWKCTTPGMRNKFEPSFSAMSETQLRTMANSVVEFRRSLELEGIVEASVVTSNGHASAVQFVRYGKEWRISEM